MNKIIRDIELIAAAYNFSRVPSRKHLKFKHNQTGRMVFTSLTPSDHRAIPNIKARFRKEDSRLT
jgi:hypothetical protein